MELFENITAVFFDLDDTLYQRCRPFQEACKNYLDLDDEAFTLAAYKTCAKRGDEVFYMAQRGEITMDEMYIYRYTKGFADVGYTITDKMALDFVEMYKKAQHELKLDPEIRDLLDDCKRQVPKMGIISNGQQDHQMVKVQALGLKQWFPEDLILITGALGVDKPDPKVFEIAEERAGVKGEQCMMVGDSYEKDILPAQKRGWRTWWVKEGS